jgi:hypothetical protein
MSSAVVSTSAAQSRLFIFDDESAPEVPCHPEYPSVSGPVKQNENGCPTFGRLCQKWGSSIEQSGKCEKWDFREILPQESLFSANPKLAHITSASRLAIRPTPEMVPSGIAALDTLTGGLPRGCITEICGPASSGRTSILLAALSAATRRGECCALIDATDALDPDSATAAGIDLDRLLWVRCNGSSPPKNNSPRSHPSALLRKKESEHRLEQVLRATDLLLESGGFCLIALDLADVPPESARRIPLTTWFRFRRAIEHTPTILLVIEPQPIAGSCSSVVMQLGVPGTQCPVPSSKPSHSHLLTGLEITMELIRSRRDRKPAQSVAFATRAAWAG